jgi:excinuclease UvrABC nuclease subunit
LLFAPELLTNKALVNLVRQLDRRFMQLVEKVDFERANELVDYSKLKPLPY